MRFSLNNSLVNYTYLITNAFRATLIFLILHQSKCPWRNLVIDELLMEAKCTLPGLGYEADLLSSALTVLAHHQPEGQIVTVLGWRRHSWLWNLSDLHLHILQSGIVHHNKALLTVGRIDYFIFLHKQMRFD